MGYQPQIRANSNYKRREKSRAKSTRRKRRSGSSELSEEKHVPTLEEVIDRAINKLRNLGNQQFGLSPFSEHFIRWLVNLRDILSEFESSSTISVDDQFVEESSQIFSGVELSIEEMRRKEASREEVIRSLSNARVLLKQIEEEYASKIKENEERRDDELKRLSSNVNALKEELDNLLRKKMGILGAILKKAREQKEAEVTQRLNSLQKELALAEQNFKSELERLHSQYEVREQPAVEQIRERQKEVDDYEVDDSLENRRAACEALISAVNALRQRMMQEPHSSTG